MSQQQPIREAMQPIYPIPIISPPQPLLPSTNKLIQLNTKDELQIYKRQYSRLIRQNNMLLAQLAKISQEKQALEMKYNNLNVHIFQAQIDPSSHDEKKKRVRRTAGEIVREYSCYLQRCGKSYGTEASLAQHIKLKHGDMYASKEYEAYIGELRKKVAGKGTQTVEIQGEENANSSS